MNNPLPIPKCFNNNNAVSVCTSKKCKNPNPFICASCD